MKRFSTLKPIGCLSVLLILLAGCSTPDARPKNVILLIGDGMGTGQLTAAKYAAGTLEMERCPVGGLMTTWSLDAMVTDSAASATALATGCKTTKGTIAQTPDGNPLLTALERAEAEGKTTGLVCTSAITHATPAAFAAHVPTRKMEPEIAEQLAASDIEVLFGGGLGFFLPQSVTNSLRSDDSDLMDQLSKKSTVLTTEAEFRALGKPERAVLLYALNSPPPAMEGRIALPDMTAKAIEILSQCDAGFFLMVEGSQIDWGGHANDAAYLLSETLEFDAAVGVALDFAERDGHTLVIVTADHETGGFAILNGSVSERTITETAFSGKSHTAGMVPLFAFGPGAEAFGGIRDNTDVGRIISRLMQAAAQP